MAGTSIRPDPRSQGLSRRSKRPPSVSLADLREARGVSIRALEAATGIRLAALSEIERALRLPRRHELVALAGFYGVDPDDFEVVVEYRVSLDRVPGAGQEGCG